MKDFGAFGRLAAAWALIAAMSLAAAAVTRSPALPGEPAGAQTLLARFGRALSASIAALRPPPEGATIFDFTALPPGDVRTALVRAAEVTGVSRPYLVSTARRESGFNPRAVASTSSARGLFQFVDATWLEMIDRHGAKYGLAKEAKLVRFDGRGRPRIADPAERRRVLDLRFDPRLAALLAAELARENADVLSAGLKRDPTDGELYVAHFLGARDAVRLIRAAETQPRRPAAELFPAAARSNRGVFYRGKRPRTVEEVLGRLT